MAEKEFKVQNGLRVIEEAYFESDLNITGELTVANIAISAGSFDDIKILTIMGAL